MFSTKSLSLMSLKRNRKAREEAGFAKALMGFVCRFLLIYGLLMAPWPGLEQAYGDLFRAGEDGRTERRRSAVSCDLCHAGEDVAVSAKSAAA